MKLNKAALNALIGSCVIFAFGVIYTLFSRKIFAFFGLNLFFVLNIPQIAMYLLWILFFVAFHREFIPSYELQLKNTTQLVIFAYTADIVLSLFQLLIIFTSVFFAGIWLGHLLMLIAWIESLLLHILFLQLYTKKMQEEHPALKDALGLMIFGTFISLLAQTLTAIRHFYKFIARNDLEIFSGSATGYILLTVKGMGFCIFIYFLFSVYKKFKPARPV